MASPPLSFYSVKYITQLADVLAQTWKQLPHLSLVLEMMYKMFAGDLGALNTEQTSVILVDRGRELWALKCNLELTFDTYRELLDI